MLCKSIYDYEDLTLGREKLNDKYAQDGTASCSGNKIIFCGLILEALGLLCSVDLKGISIWF